MPTCNWTWSRFCLGTHPSNHNSD
ncbi:hypothetical protein NC651_019910 [Populus alba x Populus x berolinensis]|nr:hypothetical protein NC651_019910 [Populus alba x Populus x berolinensis]